MWKYENKIIESIDQVPENAIGFIYKISLMVGMKGTFGEPTIGEKIYIGKKNLFTTNRRKIGVREKKATKTRKSYKVIQKESDWLTYTGSCKELNELIALYGRDSFHFEILEFCCSKKMLTYRELWYQIHYNVLENDTFNSNILNRIFRKDIKYCA